MKQETKACLALQHQRRGPTSKVPALVSEARAHAGLTAQAAPCPGARGTTRLLVRTERGRSQLMHWVMSALFVLLFSSISSAAPALNVAIENPPGPVLPGQLVVYRIFVGNPSATEATGPLTLEASVPQYTTVTAATDGQCSPKYCTSGYVAPYGNVEVWKVPSLEPGESWWTTFRPTLEATAPAGEDIELDVIAKIGATKAASAQTKLAVAKSPASFDLVVTGARRVAPGGTLDFSLRFGNHTLSAAPATLRASIPKGTSVVSASSGATLQGNVLEWSLGKIASGYSDHRELRLKVASGAVPGSFIELSPQISDGSPGGEARATSTTLIGAPSILRLDVKAAPDPAVPGGTIVYKVEITNTSRDAQTGELHIYADIPVNASLTRLVGGQCAPTYCTSGYIGKHGTFPNWPIASLGPGATAPLQFALAIDKPAKGAPPPNGTLLHTWFVAGDQSNLVQTDFSVALGTAAALGKGAPLVAIKSESATAPPSPPTPPPAQVVAPEPPPAILAAAAVDEPEVEEIPEAAIAEELPPAEDAASKDEIAKRKKWQHGDWSAYCQKRWNGRRWDRDCAKLWWKRHDWSKYCAKEGRQHAGWKKFCARDWAKWRFAKQGNWQKDKNGREHGHGDAHSADRKHH